MADRTLSDAHPDQLAQPSADQVSAPEHENPNETRSTRLLREIVRSAPDRRRVLGRFVRTVLSATVPSSIEYESPGLSISIPREEFELLFELIANYVDELEEYAFAGGRPAPASSVDGTELREGLFDEYQRSIQTSTPCRACGVTETRTVSGHESCASCGTSKEAPRG